MKSSTLTLDELEDVLSLVGDCIIANLPTSVRISRSASHKSNTFLSTKLGIKRLIDELGTHVEGEKEGSCWSPATFSKGLRAAENVKQIGLIVFDCDRGQPITTIIEKLEEAGYAALVTTSYSHGLTSQKVRIEEWNKFARENPGGGAKEFLRIRGYDEIVFGDASIAEKNSSFVKIRHGRCDKARIVLFPRRPFKPATLASIANAGRTYRDFLERLAGEIGLAIDRSATDLARLFFDPRHPRGQKPSAFFIPGNVVDVDAVGSDQGNSDQSESGAENPKPGDATDDEDFAKGFRRRNDIPIELVRELVNAVINDEVFASHQMWFGFLAAIFDASSGSEEGRLIAKEFSERWTCGSHNEVRFNAAWRSIKYRPDGPTIGTLYFHAKRCGWEASPNLVRDQLGAHGDIWNGERFAEANVGSLLYIAKAKSWMGYQGPAWLPLASTDIDATAKKVAREILVAQIEAARADPDDANLRKRITFAASVHKSLPAIRRMAESAASEPGMSVVNMGAFDQSALLYCAQNGVVDLRSVTLLANSPTLMVSKVGGAAFDPSAKAPTFEAFLRRVLPDAEIREFLQVLVGYTLTGLVDEEAVILLFGTGANGKSVFANILAALFGDYSVSLGSELITKGKNDNEKNRLQARLPGVRLALMNETAVGDLWDSQKVKELASRERLPARRLFEEGFDFFPTHKIWIRTNHLPGSLDSGHGLWRRIIAIPFEEQIPREEMIPDLDRGIIDSELSGVLNWALAGTRKYFEDGKLRLPKSVVQIVEDYKEETDVFGQWIADFLELDVMAKTPIAEAYESYRDYCIESGLKPFSKVMLSRVLKDRGFKRSVTTSVRSFDGFRVKQIISGKFETDTSEE